MRPIETLEAARFAMPAGACDAHMHVFGPLSKYPCVEHPHYTLPDGNLDHFQRLMAVLGFDRFVIVQPSFYGVDNTCLLDALAIAGDCARGVVMVEPDVGADDLAAFHAAGVRAVRLDLFKLSAASLRETQAYITHMATKIAPLGWHLQFYAPGWRVRDLIAFLADLDTDFVIDHMGYMLEEDGLTDADFARLVDLMKAGRCHIKLSAPYRLAKTRGYEAVEDVAKALVRAAPEKAIWGSDWPHIPQSGRDTGELLNLLPTWAPDADDRRLILVENPRRLFGFS
jgi:2-pyrone-4,6-dicarboxylate lactonase